MKYSKKRHACCSYTRSFVFAVSLWVYVVFRMWLYRLSASQHKLGHCTVPCPCLIFRNSTLCFLQCCLSSPRKVDLPFGVALQIVQYLQTASACIPNSTGHAYNQYLHFSTSSGNTDPPEVRMILRQRPRWLTRVSSLTVAIGCVVEFPQLCNIMADWRG